MRHCPGKNCSRTASRTLHTRFNGTTGQLVALQESRTGSFLPGEMRPISINRCPRQQSCYTCANVRLLRFSLTDIFSTAGSIYTTQHPYLASPIYWCSWPGRMREVSPGYLGEFAFLSLQREGIIWACVDSFLPRDCIHEDLEMVTSPKDERGRKGSQ